MTDRRGAGHAPGNLDAGQGVNHGFIAGIVAGRMADQRMAHVLFSWMWVAGIAVRLNRST